MEAMVIAQVLRGIQAGVGWFIHMRGGDNAGALDVVEGYLSRPGSRLDPDVFDIVKMAASGLQFLSSRGISTSEARALLVEADGRDLTDEEVEGFLAGTRAVADRVEDKLAALEREEAEAEVVDKAIDPASNPAAGGSEATPPTE